MIEIKEKKDCCGCWACVQRCPKHCITMKEDSEGFLYPEVDQSSCIDCGLCEKVCPVINREEARRPLESLAAINPDEKVRMASSSGGVFTLLATQVLAEGGVVFGARFNDRWEVVHDVAEDAESLAALRESKYVQSRIGDSFARAERYLKSGRKVLFTGTPCQIAGLRRFLRKEYDGLLAVDFICHGVPSPGVFRQYLKEVTARQRGGKNTVSSHPLSSIAESDAPIAGIRFRDKVKGWKKFSFSLTLSATGGSGTKNSVFLSEVFTKNLYLKGFLADLYLRPSCYSCPAKSLSSGSDVTIADFWGVSSVLPDWDDDSGTSVVLVNTEKGRAAVATCGARTCPADFDTISRLNPAVNKSVPCPAKRSKFFIQDGRTFQQKIKVLCRPTLKARVCSAAASVVRTVLGRNGLRHVKSLMGRK